MPYVVAALIILAVVCLLNLLLTYGIIRRLRAQSGGHDPAEDLMLPANAVVPEFTARTTTGDTVSRSTVSGGVIAFFSPGCGACEVQLPRFVDLARTLAGDEDRPVLAVLHGDEEETREHLAALTQVTDVVVEQTDGPIGTAFDVSGYPTFALIDTDGKITASSFAVNRLPLPAATASAARAE
ncbi:TlpA disulfide reductase family protein [Actinoallomurus sp. NPDC050550]|uniref:TlpA family protein disulfide reductase n=1 Tax=Actinoallomurus sp. NPDC050550 TaxID=3154937 RepID=UPI0033FAA613